MLQFNVYSIGDSESSQDESSSAYDLYDAMKGTKWCGIRFEPNWRRKSSNCLSKTLSNETNDGVHLKYCEIHWSKMSGAKVRHTK